MFERFKTYWFTTLIIALCFITFFAMPTTNHLTVQCKISAETKQPLSQGTWLTYTVTNNTDKAVKLLTWYTPFEGFFSNLFDIKDSQNNMLNYQGPMVKRTAPTEGDYLLIPAKDSASIKINLQQAYQLFPDTFQITMRRNKIQLFTSDKTLSTELCTSNHLSIEVI